MTKVRKSVKCTQSGGSAESISGESHHVGLERLPEDGAEKTSQGIELPVGQSKQDQLSNDPAEAESDSGDSLFITQKTVPEAVRRRRWHNNSSRSTPTSVRELEGSEDETSSSSQRQSKTENKKKRKKFRLPKYSFPFLTENKWKPRRRGLTSVQNARLHNATMGGFFKCVRELWQSYQRRDDLMLSLPALDMDGENISPLSEAEDASQDEDIKVVDKKCFAVSLKVKRSQSWYTPTTTVKQQMRRRNASNSSQEIFQENQIKTSHKTTAKQPKLRVTLTSDTESSDSGDYKHATGDTSILAQREAPKTHQSHTKTSKKIIFLDKKRQEEPCNDGVATVCEPLKLQGREREQKVLTTVTEAQDEGFHTDDLSQTEQPEDEAESQSLLQHLSEPVNDPINNNVCHEAGVVKKKKKKKANEDHLSVDQGRDGSQKGPESLHVAASDETVIRTGVDRAEPLAVQIRDELELNEKKWTENTSHDDNLLRQGERGIPDSTPIKRKKKKKSAAENVTLDEKEKSETDVRLEDSGFSDQVKKKKKRMTSVEDDESVAQLQSSTAGEEPLNNDAEMKRKKKKKEKECGEKSQAILESGYEEKRHKHELKQQSSFDDAQVSEEGGVDVSLSNNVGMLEGSTGLSVTKRKKKKKRESISEVVDVSYTPDKSKHEEAQKTIDVEQVTEKTKKKKKKKMNEITSRNMSEENVAQTNDPVSVRKKKRTSSFLDADSEEKDTGSHQQQSSSSKCAAAHVWHVETPGVSAGDVENESAEITKSSADGLRKKKKKKKMNEITSRNMSEENVAQTNDPVSVRKKKRTSSFLDADSEEKDTGSHQQQSSSSKCAAAHVWHVETPGVSAGDVENESAEITESSADGLRKKKKKKKRMMMSAAGENVEKDHKLDFRELAETCQSASATSKDIKRKKKRKRPESEFMTLMESLDGEADEGQTGEAPVLKKKKKKKHKDELYHVLQENTAVSEDVDASPISVTLRNQEISEKRKKKNIKSTDASSAEGKPLTESAGREAEIHKKKERNKPTVVSRFTSTSPVSSVTPLTQNKMSSSGSVAKKKLAKVKKKLHNPRENFMTDC